MLYALNIQTCGFKMQIFVPLTGEGSRFKNNGYSKLKLLPTAKFHTFALIPKSAHFNVIENPKGCANAVYDFINNI